MLIKVKVFPQSNKQKIIKNDSDSFQIYVKSKPEKGIATLEAKKILEEYLKKSIRLIKGSKTRNKIYKVLN